MSLSGRKPPSPARVECQVCSVLQYLRENDPMEADALQDMLDSPAWRGTWIEEALREEGHDVSDRSINRHRNNRCRSNRS